MSNKTTEDTLNQQEAEHAIKNYSRVPNMLVDGYNELHPQDKWLWVCLVRLCGKDRTRFLSLRYISKRTGFTPSVLSDNKKDGKPGMIRRLHNAGVIHAEIKRKKLADGSETGNEQYHITITDTWALNFNFYNKSTCSESEQDIDEDSQPVRNQNKSVRNQNGNSQTRTETEQACSDSSTNLILHSKTTDSNKITEEESITATNSLTLSSSPDGAILSQENTLLQEQLAKRDEQIAQLLEQVTQLSTKVSELSTFVEKPNNQTGTEANNETSYSRTATQNTPPPSNKGRGNKGKNKVTQSSFMEEDVKEPVKLQEPSADMKWGTRKCTMLFDYWRGAPFLTTRKLCDASTSGKQLATYYTEVEVRLAKQKMDATDYYKARNGADIEDVASNIQRYIKKTHLSVVSASQHSAPIASTSGSQYIVNELDEVAEGYIAAIPLEEELLLAGIGD